MEGGQWGHDFDFVGFICGSTHKYCNTGAHQATQTNKKPHTVCDTITFNGALK